MNCLIGNHVFVVSIAQSSDSIVARRLISRGYRGRGYGAYMRPTLAFILDQILQFWPPYRQEQDGGLDGQAEQSAASESPQIDALSAQHLHQTARPAASRDLPAPLRSLFED